MSSSSEGNIEKFSTLPHEFQAMSNPPPYSETPTSPIQTAVLLLGNSGVGKSTLLTQLGAKSFTSGVQFRRGYTKEVYQEEVELNGQRVILVDVPGLYEPIEKETQKNAKKLTVALKKGYSYKLYFVMQASNRGPDDKEMIMMSRINDCIKKANGSSVSFRVIVNQIPDQNVYAMYQKRLADDNCESLFKSMDIKGFSFDIRIDNVMLLMFDEEKVNRCGFAERIAADVCQYPPIVIRAKELKASNKDITLFEAAVMASYLGLPAAVMIGGAASMSGSGMSAAAIVATGGGAAVIAAGAGAWLLYKGTKAT
ncbi:hypothetical protein BGZ82_001826 [Podila clonocystis]|nr:hypothetical protein BGZ82_001826 [Podila clonocystis]